MSRNPKAAHYFAGKRFTSVLVILSDLKTASLAMTDRDYELRVSKFNVTEPNVQENQDKPPKNAAIFEKQTRTRGLFSSAQLFCFSLIYLVTRMGMGK